MLKQSVHSRSKIAAVDLINIGKKLLNRELFVIQKIAQLIKFNKTTLIKLKFKIATLNNGPASCFLVLKIMSAFMPPTFLNRS